MIKRILVSLSHSPAASAETAMAVDLAKQHEATVTGFTVVDPAQVTRVGPGALGAFTYQKKLMETRMQRANELAGAAMEQLQGSCRDAGVGYETLHREGRPDITLGQVWRFQDLCLMPSRPWSPGEEEPHDVTAVLHLVAMGLRPLIAVPPEAPLRPARALIALSGSLDSAKAMKHFIQAGIWPDLDVHLVTVGKPKSGDDPVSLLSQAASYAGDHGHTTSTAVLDDSGDRVAALLAESERTAAELLVIGSSFGRFLTVEHFGSHATGLLEKSKVSLFISH